jgi:carbonic anhydrase
MKNYLFLTLLALLVLATVSCNQNNSKTSETTNKQNIPSEGIKTVMTKQMQDELSPDAILKNLLDGNNRFVSGTMENFNLPAQVAATTNEQFPKALILTCIDSRVPVEYIFDQGIGDLFVARVAGNIEDEKLLGSIEYGTAVAGTKLVIVLGHENCGAIKTAIKGNDYGSKNVAAILKAIQPAIIEAKEEMYINNKEFFDKVTKINVAQTVEDIKSRSTIISDLVKEGKVKIVGAYYSLENGKVTILEDDPTHKTHNH